MAIICSFYYIRVETLSAFIQKISDHVKLREIIEIITYAEELSEHQYRPREYETIAQLLTQVNEKAVNKVHGLILLHLYRIQMPAELLQECRAMLPLWVRLTHALVDIVSSYGYLKPLIFCMQFCQMLVQAMWINESPLLQILDRPTVRLLNETY